MSKDNYTESKKESPVSIEEIEKKIREDVESIIFLSKEGTGEEIFFSFEKLLQGRLAQLACLFFQLFLMALQERLDVSTWLESGRYYRGDLVSRTIKTIYGKVKYWRTCLIYKEGLCFYPLDAAIGLTRDGFTPLVMNLSTKLATRVSFSVSTLLFRSFCTWSPSSESIQSLILGMGRDSNTYMERTLPYPEEGDIIVIEVDGKATPTATQEELTKRRKKRKNNQSECKCTRHRHKHKRLCRAKNLDARKEIKARTVAVLLWSRCTPSREAMMDDFTVRSIKKFGEAMLLEK